MIREQNKIGWDFVNNVRNLLIYPKTVQYPYGLESRPYRFGYGLGLEHTTRMNNLEGLEYTRNY